MSAKRARGLLHARAGSLDSGVHQTESTLHGGRKEGRKGDTDRCGRTKAGGGGGAAGGEHARVRRGR